MVGEGEGDGGGQGGPSRLCRARGAPGSRAQGQAERMRRLVLRHQRLWGASQGPGWGDTGRPETCPMAGRVPAGAAAPLPPLVQIRRVHSKRDTLWC